MLLPVTCRAVCWAASEVPPREIAPKRPMLMMARCHRLLLCRDFQKVNAVEGGLAAVPHIKAGVLRQAGDDFQYFREPFHDSFGNCRVDAGVAFDLFDDFLEFGGEREELA